MDRIFELTWAFLKIGFLSIGGGYAVIPMIQQQVVEKYGWISMREFADIIAISQMTPGPLAVNTSTFIGIRAAGPAGAFLATFGCVISGIVISALLYSFFRKKADSVYVSGILRGLKAVSLGLIMSAAATILLLTFTGGMELSGVKTMDCTAAGIVAAALFLLRRKKGNPMAVMLLAGAAGFLFYARAG